MKATSSIKDQMLFFKNTIETFKGYLASKERTTNLNKDDMVYLYNRLVEISRHRKAVNKFLEDCPDKDVRTMFDVLNELSDQEKQIELVLNRNLREQNMDYTDLLSQKQINAINNFRSLLVMASKRVKVAKDKELLKKDIQYLTEKFNNLDEENVDKSLVQQEFINTIDEIEDSL